MHIRRSILLAAVAAIAANPAFAQDGLPPPTAGDAVYGGSYGGAVGGAYGGSYGGGYSTGGWTEGTTYESGYVGEPAYYDEPDYYYEEDAGSDYADGYVGEPAYAPAPPAYAAPPPAYTGPAPYPGGYAQPAPLMPQAGQRMGYSPEQRADWLRQCRARYGRDNDDGLGGAVIGGVVGGVIGNRVAGKGNRTEGTIIGAGVGALAGAAIDTAEDRGRAAGECEDYLNRYEAYYSGGGYAAGGTYGAGYGQNVIYVPMIVGWDCKPKKAKVVEEWVEEAPVARRVIYTKPTKVIRTKVIKETKYSK